MNRIDVIIPCHNYGHFLPECVQSVLDQPEVDVRVLIIDDASSDDSAEVCRRLASEDERIELRLHESNHGHIESYNEGLEWVTADCCLLISADDIVTPMALTRVASVMARHPEVTLAYGPQIVFDTEPTLPADYRYDRETDFRIRTGEDFLEESCRTASNLVPTPTAIVRTEITRKTGGYRRQLPHTADLELWIRLATFGPIAVLETRQAFKRVHGQSMERLHFSTARMDIEGRRAAFQSLFTEYAQRIPDRERLWRTTIRRLAEDAFWAAGKAFDAGACAQCDDLLTLSRSLDPSIVERPPWQRMRIKRRLGPRVWAAVRPFADRSRHAWRAARSLLGSS